MQPGQWTGRGAQLCDLGKMSRLSEPPQTRRPQIPSNLAIVEPSRHGLCRLVMSWHWFLAPRNTRRLYWAFVGTTFVGLLQTQAPLYEEGPSSFAAPIPAAWPTGGDSVK